MTGLTQDFRFAGRLLRRSPGFAAAAIATLALGIGANIALFGVVDAVLLRPLPFTRPERLVAVVTQDRRLHFRAAASPPDFLDYRKSMPSLAEVAASRPWAPNLTGDGPAERLSGLMVSANFFSTLGVAAARGRTFLPDEDRPGKEKIVVLSDALWRTRFGGAADIVGKTIRLNGEPYGVAGIMPSGFRWGRAYGQESPASIWAPFALTPERIAADQRGNEYLDVIGRLRPGASRARAQSEADALLERFRRDFPEQFPRGGGMRTTIEPLREDVVGSARLPLWILLGAVGFLLLIACTNVASLLLARAAGRRSEIGIRLAVGATRRRIVRQLLCESVLLAGIAAALGVGVGDVFLRLFVHHGQAIFPRLEGASLDLRVIVFTLAVSAATAVLFGLAPALSATRLDLRPAIDEGRAGPGAGRSRLRRVLVGSQIGLASLLLIGAGLLVHSFSRLLRVPPGFDPRHVLTGQISLPRARYPVAARAAYIDAVLARFGALPGVSAASAVSILPMAGNSNSSSFIVENRPPEAGGTQPHADSWAATPDYFRAMGIPVRRGRAFSASDRASSLPVAVIDEALAGKYFGREDPIGKRIDFEGDPGRPQWRVIVGVVGTVKARTLDDEPRPAFYAPFAQTLESSMTMVVRSRGDTRGLAESLRRAVASVDPDQPIANVIPLADLVSDSVGQRRLITVLLSCFAAGAIALAALGIYGVLAYSVVQRRREIGVRMALGAPPGSIARLILRESVGVLAAGIGAGMIGAALLTRLLSGLLFGIAPLDPVTFAEAAGILTAAGLLASYLPARRAARIDPLRALRTE